MRISIISGLLAIGMMALSCTKSGLEAPREPGEPNAESVTVALASVSAPAPVEAVGSAPGTKASTEMPEATVDGRLHDLWAIQYDENGKLVGAPYYTSDVPEGTAAASGSGMDYKYDGLSLKLTSSGAKTHTVYFVGNTASGSLFSLDNDVSTLDKLKAAVHRFGNEYKPNEVSGIVMMGIYTGSVASGTPINGVRLGRLAAKVVFRYKNSIPGFEFTSVQMRNVPAAFRFVDPPAEGVNFPTVANGSHIDYPAEDISKAVADGDYKKFVWYVPENFSRAKVPVLSVGDRTPEKSDGAPSYVEITGIVKQSGQCRKATLKILLGDLGAAGADFSDFNVKRNTIYTVTLDLQGLNIGDNRLTVESFDMSNSAIVVPNSGDAGAVTFDIRKLTKGWQTTMPALGASAALRAEILWSDVASVIKPGDITLDKVNGLLTVKSTAVTNGNAIIALYDKATAGQGEILWSWHVWVTDYQPGKAGVSTRAANTAYLVPGGQVHTYGTEFQKVNGMSRAIMDRNLGATKAYYNAPAAGDGTADEAFGMFYQWGRKDPFPRVKGSTINATTAAGTTIPIYGANGTTVLPEDGTGYKKINITGGGVISGTNTLAYAVKNPLAFIYNNATPFDWYTNVAANQNNDLWGDGAMKSAYDPCPKGWRIAPNGTWSDFTRDASTPLNGTFPYYSQGTVGEAYGAGNYMATNGRLYKVSTSGNGSPLAWYPAPGYRDAGSNGKNGDLSYVGYSGYSWSSSVNGGIRGLDLNFHTQLLHPSSADSRAYGLQVRCLQE